MNRVVCIIFSFLLLLSSSLLVSSLSLRKHKRGSSDDDGTNDVLSKFKRESRGLVRNAQIESAKELANLLPIDADQVLEMEEEEEIEEEAAYPIDPEQETEHTDDKYDRAMSILDGMIKMGDSNFSSSSSSQPPVAPVESSQVMTTPDVGAGLAGLTMPAMPQQPSPVQLGGRIPDPLLQALQQQQQQQQLEQEVEEAGGEMENPAVLEQKYMEALARAQAQERLNAQEKALSDRVRQQHEAAIARAKYDHEMVEYLKNMTAQWEQQANASEAAANRTEEMMMEINGAQVARAKLEKAAEEQINAQREHAMRQAEVKRYEDALTQLKELEVNATSRKENASATLEEAFELFQKNSNQTASAAIAKAGTSADVLSQLGGMPSTPMMTLPPGIAPPGVDSVSSSSSSGSSSPQPLFARLVPPPLGNVVMGSSSTQEEGGISNPGAAVKDAMENAGYPMLDTGSTISSEAEEEGE